MTIVLSLRLSLLLVLWTGYTSSQDNAFCEAKKSWASIVASDPAPPLEITKAPPVKKQKTGGGRILAPGVYGKLPKGAVPYRVRNVYDGDTLTLTNEQRIRFLGIDTPELAEKQPFAKEAKQYVKDYCPKNGQVYLTFPSSEKEDKYGRWLAMVWVKLPDNTNNSYLCLNEGLVAAGLATVYLANKQIKFPSYKTMLALQRQARNAKRGIWTHFVDFNVVATQYGSAYHKPTCGHVSHSRNLKKLKASQAADQGLHPCRTCLADQ